MVIIEQTLDDLAHAVPFLAVQAGELFVRQRERSAVHAARREVVRVEMREGKVLERHEYHLGDLGAGLRELARTIKPGGKVVILEFSRPRNRAFRALYEFYSYKILPRIGGLVSRDKRAYEYLPASVGEFPAPEEFMGMMARAGFRNCRARSQSFGIAQIYIGEK